MSGLDWLYCLPARENQVECWGGLTFCHFMLFLTNTNPFCHFICKALTRVVVLYDREGTSGKPGGRVLAGGC